METSHQAMPIIAEVVKIETPPVIEKTMIGLATPIDY